MASVRGDECTVILDVGHGNCAVVRSGGHTAIIDAGPGSSLLEHLTDEKIKTVDVALLSHADRDHIEGMIALLSSAEVSVRKVHLNSDALKGSDLWNDLIYEIDELRLAGKLQFEVSLTASTPPLPIGNVQMDVLAPSPALAALGPGGETKEGRKISSNTISAVLCLRHETEPRILFAGDLDRLGLDDIERCKVDLDADVLVFPHHGGLPGTTSRKLAEDFAEKLAKMCDPTLVVFSIARAERPKNPLPEVVAAVMGAVSGVRVKCTQLSTNCASDLPKAPPTHLANVFSRGRSNGRCCSGSIVVAHDQLVTEPTGDDHQAFVQLAAPKGLCQR